MTGPLLFVVTNGTIQLSFYYITCIYKKIDMETMAQHGSTGLNVNDWKYGNARDIVLVRDRETYG